jgi:hypothetical protein
MAVLSFDARLGEVMILFKVLEPGLQALMATTPSAPVSNLCLPTGPSQKQSPGVLCEIQPCR